MVNGKIANYISDRWVQWALTPTPSEPTYGFMNWFLNTDRKLMAERPVRSLRAHRQRGQPDHVDPDHDLVAVVRWIDGAAADGFVKRLIAALD